jgi:hypothetical protein
MERLHVGRRNGGEMTFDDLVDKVFGVFGRGSHSECSEDYYFGSEDRGDNRCDLCRLKDELRILREEK